MLESNAFLKGHDEFNRKKPKDEISGTVRLDEYGVHPDLWGGDKWGALNPALWAGNGFLSSPASL